MLSFFFEIFLLDSLNQIDKGWMFPYDVGEPIVGKRGGKYCEKVSKYQGI